jgi:hypothetical protein
MRSHLSAAVVVMALTSAHGVQGQERAPVPPRVVRSTPAERTAGASVPLRVTVLLSRYQGDKRISSMPYVLGVAAGTSSGISKTTLRMGVEVPIATTVFSATSNDGKGTPVSSYSYRSVGTNIDCLAVIDEGNTDLFQVTLTVADSSLSLETPKRNGVQTDMPSFRSFNSSFTALLRDGQTSQYTSATDPVSGEVMKIDVTLAVMK